MISRKLAERTFPIKGSPLPDRIQDSYSHRRGKNAVIMDDGDPSDKYDTFFEYEDDLANLKPSGEQYAEMVNDEPYVILEDKDLASECIEEGVEGFGSVVMEEVAKTADKDKKDKTYRDVVGFNFIQCNFMKADGDRCKRQAPTGREICSVHRKYIEKHNS